MRDADTLAVLAAMLVGERWLSADAAAVFLGLTTASGQPNRRGFLERVASRKDFPPPLIIGNEKKWRKSEIDAWALHQRRKMSHVCSTKTTEDIKH